MPIKEIVIKQVLLRFPFLLKFRRGKAVIVIPVAGIKNDRRLTTPFPILSVPQERGSKNGQNAAFTVLRPFRCVTI